MLIGQGFAVAERHIEEEPLVQPKGDGIEAGEREPRHLECFGVPAEGTGRAAEAVAWELIAKKDQRQGPFG